MAEMEKMPEMETATEDEKALSFESHISPSSLEEQPETIPLSNAQERTIFQALTAILLTDSLYHLLFIFSLFYSSYCLWSHADLDSKPNSASWHKVLSNLETALTVEIVIFAAVFALRQVWGACCAVRVEGVWVRAEERGAIRVFAFLMLLGNVVISTQFIFYPVICRSCGYDGGEGRFVCVD